MFGVNNLVSWLSSLDDTANSSTLTSTSTLSRASSSLSIERQVNGLAEVASSMSRPADATRLTRGLTEVTRLEPLGLEDFTEWMDSGILDGRGDQEAQLRGVTHLLRADLCPRILNHPLNHEYLITRQVQVPGSPVVSSRDTLVAVGAALAGFSPIEGGQNVLLARDESGARLVDRAEQLALAPAQRLMHALDLAANAILTAVELATFITLLQRSTSQAIAFLAERRPDLDQPLGTGAMTFSHLAARNGIADLSEYLIEQGANVNQRDSVQDVPLHDAAVRGSIDIVRMLLAAGAEPDAANVRGFAPLHHAAKHGFTSIARELVGHGAQVNTQKQDGYTALHLAAVNGYGNTVSALLDMGADPCLKENGGATALHFAAQKEFTQIIGKLLPSILASDPQLINTSVEYGFTPLQFTAKSGDAPGCQLLVDAGADVDAQKEDGYTALHLAALNGQLKAMKVLLAKNASVTIKNNMGDRALHLAAREGNADEVVALLAAGARANQVGSERFRPLHFAVKSGDLDTINAILAHNPNVNARQKDGFTPLHIAALDGRENMVSRLLEVGAARDVQDFRGLTASDLATAAGHLEVAQLIGLT